MYFQYDTSGAPLGFIYNGMQYFYMTNQMGDVISITDAQGNELVQYEYDEWGKCISISLTHEEDGTVANANPIRYRGYYLDSETGYYYLQSRYYDPSICRFINSDIAEISQMSKDIPVGTNLFAYCSNDPVNNSDPTGTIPAKKVAEIVLGIIFGLLAQLIADGICISLKLQKGLSTVGTYLSNIAQSALDAVLHKGIYKAMIIAAIGNGITQIMNRIIDKRPVSLSQYIYKVVSSGIKYVIKSKIKVKINSAVEKKIEQKLPYILQDIAKYAYNKAKNIYVKTISYKVIKNVISKFSSSLWYYSKNKLLSVLR